MTCDPVYSVLKQLPMRPLPLVLAQALVDQVVQCSVSVRELRYKASQEEVSIYDQETT